MLKNDKIIAAIRSMLMKKPRKISKNKPINKLARLTFFRNISPKILWCSGDIIPRILSCPIFVCSLSGSIWTVAKLKRYAKDPMKINNDMDIFAPICAGILKIPSCKNLNPL
ncbi:MAG: hypothetical protein GY699_00565 [Desulfobacteraceae bacterium]|nr:hypothetical protein [Desulfobacteraceae bacterium]